MPKISRYIDREISWLQFNERVLQEAKDPSVPLIERVRFMGIFSNNQDEFFRTRVGSLIYHSDIENEESEFEHDSQKTLKKVTLKAIELRKEFDAVFADLWKELRENNIFLINEQSANAQQKAFVVDYFRNKVRSHLFPLMLDRALKHNDLNEHLNEHSIYLFVKLSSSKRSKKNVQYAILELPTDKVSRFLVLPPAQGKEYVIMLDDVIRLSFADIFRPLGYDVYEAYTFKITRNAEVEVNTSGDTIDLIKEMIQLRQKSDVIRFLYDREMPQTMLKHLLKKLEITDKADIDTGSRYHNSKDFVKFPASLGNGQLIYKPHKPSNLKELPIHANMLAAMKKRDYMLHFPYQSFQTVIDFLREASIDPNVQSIKMTIYRVAEDSAILNALVNAARNGKRVSVYVEVKARFDEENNLYWVERLRNEGIKVMSVLPDHKVHAKMLLVTTKENGKRCRYAAIGTGNPNEETALVYTDKLLFTVNPKITTEVQMVFDLIENRLAFPKFKTLLVAPVNLRKRLMTMIDMEIEHAKLGAPAWIVMKLNSLADKATIDKLYEAAGCGVKIRLLVRGICALNPELPECEGNITVLSVVDKFLEHARMFGFCNGGKSQYFIGSADFVKQKLDKRIEVVVPLLDPDVKQEVEDILNIQFQDNTHARWVSPSKINTYVESTSRRKHRSQEDIQKYLSKKHGI
ncbi:MAG: polyphosphate kinase 1 [Bacteroidales bacterium]|jgi:polyphosphate kinase|nr:polyphosphate kinase 1 [Bacteroidales bacterium]